ncbi:SCO family protein [Piscinibacter sakaiensis]|uniref:SCO family protein n=1 Tax=Piscinibacter sakaiensis TaxID=1547922 RepID=UPI003AB0959A
MTSISSLRTAGVALLLAAGIALSGCDRLGLGGGSSTAFKGVDITGADYAKTLELPDIDGKPRSLDEFKGKVVVVFFGYTHCPDVCPTTMAELAQVKQSLGADGDKVQGIFVSVDPERDTPEILKAYMASFDPGFVALRGTPEQTAAVAKSFKVFFAKVPGTTDGGYTVDHTAGSYVFDPAGRLRLFVRYGGGADALASDLKALLKAG